MPGPPGEKGLTGPPGTSGQDGYVVREHDLDIKLPLSSLNLMELETNVSLMNGIIISESIVGFGRVLLDQQGLQDHQVLMEPRLECR